MYYKPPIENKKSYLPLGITVAAAALITFLFILFSGSEPEELSVQPIRLPDEITKSAAIEPPINKVTEQNKKQTFTIKPGDSLSSIFEKAGLSNKLLITLLGQSKHKSILENIKLGQKLHITETPKGDFVKLYFDPALTQRLIIEQTKTGQYQSTLKTLKPKHQQHYLTATIKNSLYETGIKYRIPHSLLLQLTQIFARHINFAKDIRNNDKLTLIYQTDHVKNGPIRIGRILAARYTSAKKTYTAVRYQKFNKETDYFTPEGRSLRLSFDRFPIKYTHISSHFDPHRKHPILNVTRPHKGIDLAAHQGTEIRAVADGQVVQIGLNSGFGKMIKLKHSNKYETVYAHMVRFKPSLSRSKYVKRGEVIGYVGQTGLATAPHCHFEFRISGKQVDPATTPLPTAPDITHKALMAFKQKTQSLLEQLALYESAQLASTS